MLKIRKICTLFNLLCNLGFHFPKSKKPVFLDSKKFQKKPKKSKNEIDEKKIKTNSKVLKIVNSVFLPDLTYTYLFRNQKSIWYIYGKIMYNLNIIFDLLCTIWTQLIENYVQIVHNFSIYIPNRF